jgi:predicted alpha/beta hydrolase
MNKLKLLLLAACLTGCATASKTFTADGKEGYNINCSGSALNWGMCYEKAGELCGEKGYEILEKSGDRGTMVTFGQYGLMGGSVINRSMIVKCKE